MFEPVLEAEKIVEQATMNDRMNVAETLFCMYVVGAQCRILRDTARQTQTMIIQEEFNCMLGLLKIFSFSYETILLVNDFAEGCCVADGAALESINLNRNTIQERLHSYFERYVWGKSIK